MSIVRVLTAGGIVIMFLSTILLIRITNLLITWIIIEVNLLRFLLLILSFQGKEELVKYFISQRLGSILFLFGRALGSLGPQEFREILVFSRLLLKLGVPPVHWWFIRVVSKLCWERILLLISWQKIGPLFLLFKSQIWFLGLVVGLRAIIGSLGSVKHKRKKPLLAYVSIARGGWGILCCPNMRVLIVYLSVFTLSRILWSLRAYFSEGRRILEVKSLSQSRGLRREELLGRLRIIGIPPILRFYVKIYIMFNLLTVSRILGALMLLILGPFLLFSLLQRTIYSWKLGLLSRKEVVVTRKGLLFSVSVSLILILGGAVVYTIKQKCVKIWILRFGAPK